MDRRAPWGMGPAVRWAGLATAAAVLPSCVITYTDFPRAAAAPVAVRGARGALVYRINRWPVFVRGRDVLTPTFQRDGGFGDVIRLKDPAAPVPARGLFCDVAFRYRLPSAPATLSAYVSLVTLTLWPTYSGRDGYDVTYSLYRDGTRLGERSYTITRKAGIWLPLVVLSWINVFTPSEKAAFTSTARQFLAEARTEGWI